MRRFTHLCFFLSLLGSYLLHSAVSNAQTADALTEARVDWHLANLCEYRLDARSAINYYTQLKKDCRILPLDVREWFRGMANFGIAHNAAVLFDTALVRLSLERAFQQHFWNVPLMQRDTSLMSVCGQPFFDSLSGFWFTVYQEERTKWPAQEPIVLIPNSTDSASLHPLIIAMDGGNGCYEEFAMLWQTVVSEINAVIVIPPGIDRNSSITNSWDTAIDRIEPVITTLAEQMIARYPIDISHIYLAGFSQGAQAAIELTLRNPMLFHGVFAMSGFAHALPDSVLQAAATVHPRIYAVSGEFEDTGFRSQIQDIHDRCQQAGILFELRFLPGTVHEVPLDFRRQLLTAWTWLTGQP